MWPSGPELGGPAGDGAMERRLLRVKFEGRREGVPGHESERVFKKKGLGCAGRKSKQTKRKKGKIAAEMVHATSERAWEFPVEVAKKQEAAVITISS